MSKYNLFINSDAVARMLQQQTAEIAKDLQVSVEHLSIQTRAKILEMANQDLKGYHREAFLGNGGENVRWRQVSQTLWAVEIDESVMMYDSGRGPTSMATTDWLLKNAKRAKDGSLYKVIPFKHDIGPAGAQKPGVQGQLNQFARRSVQQARTKDGKRMSVRTIEKNADGTPKLGILHKVPINNPFEQSQIPEWFSKPRTAQDAAKSGLKAHGGIFKLQGLAISQRMVGGRAKREAVTFRVVSSKHQAENRWMYPQITGHHFLERAFQWATNVAWPEQMRELKARFAQRK